MHGRQHLVGWPGGVHERDRFVTQLQPLGDGRVDGVAVGVDDGAVRDAVLGEAEQLVLAVGELDVAETDSSQSPKSDRSGFTKGEVCERTFADGNRATFLRMSRSA